MNEQAQIQAHPENTLWKASGVVLTFDGAGRPDRILIKRGREVIHDVPARKITRLEGSAPFSLYVQHPQKTVRRNVVDALLRFDMRSQDGGGVRVDAILISTVKGAAYERHILWHRRA